MTNIATDNGNRAFAESKIDLAIPFSQSEELREILKKINELTEELASLTDRANNIYAHGYITISINSQAEKDF